MTTFFMFGKYSSEAVKGISAERTKHSVELIKKYGGEMVSIYALFGEKDLVFIVKFRTLADAIGASVGLNELTGISFSTIPAMTADEFDEAIARS
jgi:uncharacterized protein with GYD domain